LGASRVPVGGAPRTMGHPHLEPPAYPGMTTEDSMAFNSRVRPSAIAGLCAVCAGTAMMPRSAPPEARVACEACNGTGVLA